jgi:CBS domain-containing protein
MKNFQQKKLGVEKKDRKLNIPSVEDYMVKDLITFTPDTQIFDVIDSLISNGITGAPVLNSKGKVVGLIDDKDCLKVLFGGAYYNVPAGKSTVSTYMSNIMKTIPNTTDIMEVAGIFLQTNFKRLLVMDDSGRLVGQISRRDTLRAVKDMETNTW